MTYDEAQVLSQLRLDGDLHGPLVAAFVYAFRASNKIYVRARGEGSDRSTTTKSRSSDNQWPSQKHVDEVTGVETTGHVWDGDLMRAQQAATAMVALRLLCLHRLGIWLLARLSGLADADRLYQRITSATASAVRLRKTSPQQRPRRTSIARRSRRCP